MNPALTPDPFEETRDVENGLIMDQLYEESRFLSYCNDEHYSSVDKKLGVKITPEFLSACAKDEFILPIHTQIEKRMTEKGEVEMEVKYYSPFQLFLVVMLHKNTIGKDGFLSDPYWGNQEELTTRYISWGGQSAFNIENRHSQVPVRSPMTDHYVFMKDFHTLLRFLHTLPTLDGTRHGSYYMRRLYRGVPKLQYEFKGVTKDTLLEHNLTIEILSHFVKVVGQFALIFDPLEQWYNYVHKHDLLRKDELKGMTGVAQELYNFCDIIRSLIEHVEGKELPPFLQYVKSDFYISDRDKVNTYAKGEDILAIKKANEKMIAWITKNKDYIDDINSKHDDWEKVDILAVAKNIQKELDDFHTRYGDIRYVGSSRTELPSDKKLEDLDPKTRWYFDMVMDSRARRKKDDDDEGYKVDPQIEISRAISSRLGDLQRDVMTIAHKTSDMLMNDRSRIEREKQMSVGPLQEEYFKLHDHATDPNPDLTNSLFWSDFLPKGQKKYDDEMELSDRKRKELNAIGNEADFVFCAKCRTKHVVVHQLHHDEKLSNEAICDGCMEITDLQSIRKGEWHCEHTNEEGVLCDRLLYKFAHNNILNTTTLNTSVAKIQLNYGQMEIEVTCPSAICRKKSYKVVEWGWLP